MDGKYVVFKREDWQKGWEELISKDNLVTWDFPPEQVEDAVVIRRQDIFAPAALYGYAHAVLTARDILEWGSSESELDELDSLALDSLTELADYFASQADLATKEQSKVPD